MVERQEYIPLARAAALAHDQLFPADDVKAPQALDVIALALSVLIPLYQRDTETGSLRALLDSELAAGRFTRGATALEFPNRPALQCLVVPRRRLYEAIDSLREDALGTGRRSLISRHCVNRHRRA